MDNDNYWDRRMEEEPDGEEEQEDNICNNDNNTFERTEEGAREWRNAIAEEMWEAYLYHSAAKDMEAEEEDNNA